MKTIRSRMSVPLNANTGFDLKSDFIQLFPIHTHTHRKLLNVNARL
jgi:hypothetical protein